MLLIARHCWALTRSTHPHSREYTNMQLFVMHRFQGCRASLESLCINFGGELSTMATLMFTILNVLLNNSALLSLDQKYPSTLTWIHKYATLCNALFLRMQSIPGKFMHQFWGWAVHHCYTDVHSTECATQRFGTFFDFLLSLHDFVHSTISNFSTNSDDQYIST